MSKVVLTDVRKSYGALTVVHGVNITLEDGEFIAFLGPSGCGKSTTLRMIAGLEMVSGGTIHIGNRDVTQMQPRDRNIGMVFQNYALYPNKTVEENLGFGLRMHGVSKPEIAQRVARSAEMLSLEPLLHRKPSQLSGGQMQRVALGRALVRDADVFLLDEPLSNLDAKLRAHMRIELSQLHRKLGKTMIYVTHDQVEAMTMADRVVIMREGNIEQVGTPLEIFDHPASRFVAGFVGTPEMNFFDVILTEQGIDIAGTVVDAPQRPTQRGRAVLGVRPEHMRIDPHGPLEFTVDVAEQYGTATLIVGTINGIHAQIQTPRVEASYGEKLRLSLDGAPLHFFDSVTGRRISGP